MHARSFYMLLMLLLGFAASPQTTADKNEGSVDDVVSDKQDESSSCSYSELGLCVPQDRLEDIDFSPNLDDDWIRLDLVFEQEDSSKDSRQDSAKDSRQESDNGEVEETKPNPLNSYDFFEERNNYSGRLLDFDYTNLSSYVEREDRRNLLAKKPRTKKLTRENHEMVRRRGRKRSSELLFKRMKRCSHCEAEDTPQWRLGPLGPNTLCNACGLRYKMGRLLENYRPAASPSFDVAKHSNYYKRIMRQNYVNLI